MKQDMHTQFYAESGSLNRRNKWKKQSN